MKLELTQAIYYKLYKFSIDFGKLLFARALGGLATLSFNRDIQAEVRSASIDKRMSPK